MMTESDYLSLDIELALKEVVTGASKPHMVRGCWTFMYDGKLYSMCEPEPPISVWVIFIWNGPKIDIDLDPPDKVHTGCSTVARTIKDYFVQHVVES
jgi:hypothetical protein